MIEKAIIPVAGKGTRLLPVTCVVPKAMFPLVDNESRVYSVLHVILRQVKKAGIETAAIIISPSHELILQNYFKTVRQQQLNDLPGTIEFIIQPSPEGFGHAVLQGKDFVGDDPFVLLLGDHIHISSKDSPNCLEQVLIAFNSFDPVAMIGVQTMSIGDLSRVGVTAGELLNKNVYKCKDFIEKPDPQTARERLVTNGLEKDTFLAHCGIYAFAPEIFQCLNDCYQQLRTSQTEVELAHAQSLLLETFPDRYLLNKISGRAYDTGTPELYIRAQAEFSNCIT